MDSFPDPPWTLFLGYRLSLLGERHVWDQRQTLDHLRLLGKRSTLSSFLTCLGKLASSARVSGALPLADRTVKR